MLKRAWPSAYQPVPAADGMPPDAYDEENSDIDLLNSAPPPCDAASIEPFEPSGD
jgi:hypothetical protein